MSTVIAVANQKGGVGKTSLCLHMAGVFAERGIKTLLVDMDQQGNLSSVFVDNIHRLEITVADLLNDDTEIAVKEVIRQTHIKNIDVLPANLSLGDLDAKLAGDDDAQFYLLEALQEIRKNYGYVLIDCPPNLGRAIRMVLVAAQGVLIPIECQDWAFVGSNQIIVLVDRLKKRANPKLKISGFVINKYQPRRTMEQDYNHALREQYGKKILKTEFRDNVQYAEASAMKKPITHYQPKSEQAEAYRQLVEELL